MRKLQLVFVLVLNVGLNGCVGSWHEFRYGPDRIVPGAFKTTYDGEQTAGGIYTWPSHAVGAMIFEEDDKACLQSAASAKARGSRIDSSVPLGSDLDVGLLSEVTEAVLSLQQKDTVATFADVSLFHVCMMSASGLLPEGSRKDAIEAVMDAASEIAKAPLPAAPTQITITAAPPQQVSSDNSVPSP